MIIISGRCAPLNKSTNDRTTNGTMKYTRFLSLSLVALLGLGTLAGFAGCSSEPASERPDKPELSDAPPPPTPEELANKEMSGLGLNDPLPRPGARLSALMRNNILNQYRELDNRLSQTPEGKGALKIIAGKLEQRIQAVRRVELWEYVLTYIDAYKILEPDSTKFNLLHDQALSELRKPKVTVHGLPEFEGRKIAVLDIYVPVKSESHLVRMRIGEEMYGIKLLDIFGDDKGVKIEYLDSGDRAIIYLEAAK